MKPIQQAFQLVQSGLCLANEWRDSLSYTLSGALMAAYVIQHHQKPSDLIFILPALREATRSFAWDHFQMTSLAGYSGEKLNKEINSNAALIVANVVGGAAASLAISSYSNIGWFGISLSCFALSGARSCIKLKQSGQKYTDIYKLYFNRETGMWDWPRKNKSNGPTQTDKVKQGFKNAFEGFGKRLGILAPQPSLVPARAMRQLTQTATHAR